MWGAQTATTRNFLVFILFTFYQMARPYGVRLGEKNLCVLSLSS